MTNATARKLVDEAPPMCKNQLINTNGKWGLPEQTA
jgi:hypothetical protein